MQGRARTSSPGRDPRATHPRSGSDPRAPPRQARRSLLADQQAPRHRLASVDRRTSTARPQHDHMKTTPCCATTPVPRALAPRELPHQQLRTSSSTPRIRDPIITSSRTREARRGRRTSKGTGSRPSARGILSLHTANASLCIARCASGRKGRRSTVPTLNGRKDPAPHPGVDLATLRFARPTPTKSPSTDSRLAGFPESSPQQIAPDTPASLLRARSCAAPRAGFLGSRGSLVLSGWAGVARSERWLPLDGKSLRPVG